MDVLTLHLIHKLGQAHEGAAMRAMRTVTMGQTRAMMMMMTGASEWG